MDKQTLIDFGATKGIDEGEIEQVLTLPRNEAVVKLRLMGLSLSEVAQYFGLSRQRVSRIAPGLGQTCKPKVAIVPSAAREIIWRKAADDLSWWNSNAKLNLQKTVDVFLEQGYTWAESREFARSIQGSKLDVVLLASFGVEPNNLAHTAFFNGLAASMPKGGILAHINEKQPLKVTKRMFDRRWTELGLQAQIKKMISKKKRGLNETV